MSSCGSANLHLEIQIWRFKRKKGKGVTLYRLDYDSETEGLVVIRATRMNESTQEQYLDVEEDLNKGRGEEISKGHSELEALPVLL